MSEILVVEDDKELAEMILIALKTEGHSLIHAATIADGWRHFEEKRPALVVLDVVLPDGSGLDMCRRVRGHESLAPTPVIMLTAKGELKDKMGGFEAGADHYLVKPFQIQELRLWVSALLRRVKFAEQEEGVIRDGNFIIDPRKHTVTLGDQVLRNLTRKEFDLLYELVRNRPKILSKSAILKSLWTTVLRDNTVEVHIRNIRAKLGPAASRIVTVPGSGYKFE